MSKARRREPMKEVTALDTQQLVDMEMGTEKMEKVNLPVILFKKETDDEDLQKRIGDAYLRKGQDTAPYYFPYLEAITLITEARKLDVFLDECDDLRRKDVAVEAQLVGKKLEEFHPYIGDYLSLKKSLKSLENLFTEFEFQVSELAQDIVTHNEQVGNALHLPLEKQIKDGIINILSPIKDLDTSYNGADDGKIEKQGRYFNETLLSLRRAKTNAELLFAENIAHSVFKELRSTLFSGCYLLSAAPESINNSLSQLESFVVGKGMITIKCVKNSLGDFEELSPLDRIPLLSPQGDFLPDNRVPAIIKEASLTESIDDHTYIPKDLFLLNIERTATSLAKDLVSNSNLLFKDTYAEIKTKKGIVKDMNILKRMALTTILYQDSRMRSFQRWPITPLQAELLVQGGDEKSER